MPPMRGLDWLSAQHTYPIYGRDALLSHRCDHRRDGGFHGRFGGSGSEEHRRPAQLHPADGRKALFLQLRAAAGLGRANLYKALSPEGNPEFATVAKVLRALGLRLTIAA